MAEKLYLIRREGRIDRVYDVVELAICDYDFIKPEWKGSVSSYLGNPKTLLQQIGP